MGLDNIELIILIEKKLNISFTDSEISKISTVGEISKYAHDLQKDKLGKTLEEVQNIIIDMLINDFNVERDEIKLTSCIVKDLGIN